MKYYFSKRHAVACLLLFTLNSKAEIPSGKLVNYEFSQCNTFYCYKFNGIDGYFSKIGSIFSANEAQVEVINLSNKKKDTYNCSDFTYEIKSESIICIDSNSTSTKIIEINLHLNKIGKLNL